MKIIKYDENIINRLPSILNLIYELYEESNVEIFAILDDYNEIGFVTKVDDNCAYINNKSEFIAFKLNEDGSLYALQLDDYVIYYDDLCFIDENQVERLLQILPLDIPNIDGYDGYILYKQYNPENDTLCEITFNQMYRKVNGIVPIYEFHTKEIDGLYIKENYDKYLEHNSEHFLLPRRYKYFTKLDYRNDNVGYNIVNIKDYGLINFLSNNIENTNRVIKYVRSHFVDKDGNYRDLWPFCKQFSREDIDKIIQSYGFSAKIPGIILDIHNKRDIRLNNILEIIEEMKKLKSIDNSDIVLRLKLYEQ